MANIGTSMSVEQVSVLRKTYVLLAATLLWSGLASSIGAQMHMSGITYIGLVIASFVALLSVAACKEGPLALLLVFVFTGLEGLTLGPLLQIYAHMPHGSHIIQTAFALTAGVFVALSAYATFSGRNFTTLGGFLFVGLLLLVVAGLASIFLHSTAMDLTLAAVTVLLFSGFILYDTSRIVQGHETSYIRATIELYLDILNLFLALLRLVAAFSGNDD